MSESEHASSRTLLAMAGAAIAATSAGAAPALAAEGDEAALKAALEQFRTAVQTGDAATLGKLIHEQLSYGHSSGRKIETKAEFISSLAGKTNYRSLAFTEVAVQVVDDNAIVRLVWEGVDILPDGGTGRSYIAVLQVWKKQGGNWAMLARQSCPLKDA